MGSVELSQIFSISFSQVDNNLYCTTCSTLGYLWTTNQMHIYSLGIWTHKLHHLPNFCMNNQKHELPLCVSVLSLYCIALHCIALHCVVLHCITLSCIALQLYCVVLCCAVLCCAVLYHTVLYRIILYLDIQLTCFWLISAPIKFYCQAGFPFKPCNYHVQILGNYCRSKVEIIVLSQNKHLEEILFISILGNVYSHLNLLVICISQVINVS